MSTPGEEELVRRCLDGDTPAFGALIERYQKVIFNAAFRMLNDYEDAKDIMQTVFLKAYENLASYDPKYRFYSWIYRIAVNESLNLINKNSRMDQIDDDTESDARGPEEILAETELGEIVQEALMALKPDYRTVVVLRHFTQCSYEDISQILQIPEKTVKSRLFSARQILKDDLSRKGALI